MSVKIGALFAKTGEHAYASAPARPVPLSHSWFGPLTAASDFLLIALLGAASGALYDLLAGGERDRSDYIGLGLVVAALTVVLFTSQSLYTRSALRSDRSPSPMLRTWLVVFAVMAVAGFLLRIGPEYSRGALVLYFFDGAVALVLVRAVGKGLLRRAVVSGLLWSRRAVLIAEKGEPPSADFSALLRCHGYSLTRSHLIDCADVAVDAPMLGEIRHSVARGEVDEILMAIRWSESGCIDGLIEKLGVLPVPVRLLPDRNASHYLGRPMSDIGLATAIDLKRAPLGAWERGIKTSIDFLIAALGLILFAPLLAAAALMIKLDSRGPVFFWQTRVGFNGQRFRILKFRTMRTLEDGDMIRQASRNDDRVTRVGRWLRATSVDELPQLVNVLLGQMAIVGPRPHAAAHDGEFDRTIANYALRHNVKPGITGWAQVCGFRGETPTIELVLKRVEHDLWYIHNWSFWLDLTILARTIAVLINPKDVY
jgi:Undecaprenyl-phosphate glucose phosphotransferase